MTLDVLIVGLIVSTAHINPPPGTTNDTPGIYVRANDWAGGYYLNSWRYPSWWIGRAFDCGPVECLVGGVTGYADAPVLPMLAVSRAWGPARLTLSAGSARSIVVTLSVEGKQ